MQSLGLGRIEFAVLHPAAGAHDLDLAGAELGVVAHAVLVLDGALEHVREDFRVLMAVGRKPHPRGHQVLIDDPEGPEGHVGRVVIIGETEAMPRHQPAVIGEASFPGTSHRKVHK